MPYFPKRTQLGIDDMIAATKRSHLLVLCGGTFPSSTTSHNPGERIEDLRDVSQYP